MLSRSIFTYTLNLLSFDSIDLTNLSLDTKERISYSDFESLHLTSSVSYLGVCSRRENMPTSMFISKGVSRMRRRERQLGHTMQTQGLSRSEGKTSNCRSQFFRNFRLGGISFGHTFRHSMTHAFSSFTFMMNLDSFLPLRFKFVDYIHPCTYVPLSIEITYINTSLPPSLFLPPNPLTCNTRRASSKTRQHRSMSSVLLLLPTQNDSRSVAHPVFFAAMLE